MFPVRIGLISAAHLHADSYVAEIAAHPQAQLTGMYDDDAARLQIKAKEYGCTAYPELSGLFAVCDAVVICSENSKHREFTEASAQAGKHILCEKPLAPSPDDARAMMQACEQAKVFLFTAFPCRFSPSFVQLNQSVQTGDLGQVLAVRATNRGKCPGGWFIQKELSGGGAVMDHTVHVADLLRVLLQAECKRVYCEHDNRILHGDFDDTGFLTLEFENGVFATLDTSWSRPRTFPTWGDVTMGVTGTEGVAEMDMFAQEAVLYDDTQNRIAYQGWGSSIDGGLVRAFVQSVQTGIPDPVLATGLDGLRAVEIVHAAYQSAEQNQPVDVRHR